MIPEDPATSDMLSRLRNQPGDKSEEEDRCCGPGSLCIFSSPRCACLQSTVFQCSQKPLHNAFLLLFECLNLKVPVTDTSCMNLLGRVNCSISIWMHTAHSWYMGLFLCSVEGLGQAENATSLKHSISLWGPSLCGMRSVLGEE